MGVESVKSVVPRSVVQSELYGCEPDNVFKI
jgi:hypothetical protein